MTMNIELPEEMKEKVEEIQKDELYSSKSEVIRAAIRQFISRKKRRRWRPEEYPEESY